MIRRMITIDQDVNDWIQNYRGKFMLKNNKDITYTEVVIMLCKRGISSTDTSSKEESKK